MEMIDVNIDNPLPNYSNNNSNDKRNQRIQSFIDNNTSVEGSSGLTLGLVLKEYSEFQVDTVVTFTLHHKHHY